MLGERKVSGTAAKLGRESAYHHCTLLVNVDTRNLHDALTNTVAAEMVETNATVSVRCPVENLLERCGEQVDIGGIEEEIARQWGGEIKEVNPTEDEFPGLEAIIEGYRSWDWTHGKSPKFTLRRGAQEMEFTSGQLSSCTHILHKGVEDVRWRSLDLQLVRDLEASYQTRVFASYLSKIV